MNPIPWLPVLPIIVTIWASAYGVLTTEHRLRRRADRLVADVKRLPSSTEPAARARLVKAQNVALLHQSLVADHRSTSRTRTLWIVGIVLGAGLVVGSSPAEPIWIDGPRTSMSVIVVGAFFTAIGTVGLCDAVEEQQRWLQSEAVALGPAGARLKTFILSNKVPCPLIRAWMHAMFFMVVATTIFAIVHTDHVRDAWTVLAVAALTFVVYLFAVTVGRRGSADGGEREGQDGAGSGEAKRA